MANPPPVKTSERPWSEEVRKADPGREQRQDPAYVFSNGRVFTEPKRK